MRTPLADHDNKSVFKWLLEAARADTMAGYISVDADREKLREYACSCREAAKRLEATSPVRLAGKGPRAPAKPDPAA